MLLDRAELLAQQAATDRNERELADALKAPGLRERGTAPVMYIDRLARYRSILIAPRQLTPQHPRPVSSMSWTRASSVRSVARMIGCPIIWMMANPVKIERRGIRAHETQLQNDTLCDNSGSETKTLLYTH